MTSWHEIKGKIKDAHDKIEFAYQKHVVSAVDKVKERPLLNSAVKTALPLIPIIGPTLSAIYDNIGGGTKSEEDKAKEVLDFLSELEQKNKEQFDRIAQDLKTNFDEIENAIIENRIAINDLISKSSGEILQAVGNVQKNTGVILDRVNVIGGGVNRIQAILEQQFPTLSELKRPPKPQIFRGESNIFLGRKEDIIKIKQYFNESNSPVSITGEGGIGKSALAFKAIHECQDKFDVIIPVYFEYVLTFNSFLLEMAKSLQLPINQFEQVHSIDEKADFIKDALIKYRRILIYADNYETIRNSIINIIRKSPTSIQQSVQEEDAIKINNFLNTVPEKTSVLLTSRLRRNLTGERTIPLDGLSIQEGMDLFREVAGDKLPKNVAAEMREAIEEISKKTGGHPLSIQILASTYAGDLLPELREMVKHLGTGVVNPEDPDSRHKSLETCFEYSISRLPETHKLLLQNLAIMFRSPFPASAVESIFDSAFESGRIAEDIIRDLHNSSLLRRIDFDEYGDIEGKYRLYHFHPSVKNYLERKVQEQQNSKQQELEERYHDQFSLYYGNLIRETFNALGTKDRVLSLERFNIIFWQGEDNDFERAIGLTNNRSVASTISTDLGSILYILGRYISASEYYNKSLAIHQELQERIGMAGDYINIGNVLDKQGNYDQALEYHNKALAIHKEKNDRAGMSKDYNYIGVVLRHQGNYDQALEYHNKALAIDKKLNDRVQTAANYNNIGIVLQALRKYDQALEYLKKALEIHQDPQDKVGMALDYTHIGLVLSNQGIHDQALEYLEKALAIDKELNDRVGISKDYRNIGLVLQAQGNYDQALEYHNKALAIDKELQIRVRIAIDYGNIGLVLFNQGNYDQALEYHNKALAIHEQLQDKVEMAKDYRNIGNAFVSMTDRERAIKSFSKGIEVLKELEEKTGRHHPLSDEIQRYISQLGEGKHASAN
jgi:tetratricopeptide (TPR) repeat protein